MSFLGTLFEKSMSKFLHMDSCRVKRSLFCMQQENDLLLFHSCPEWGEKTFFKETAADHFLFALFSWAWI